MTPSPARHRSTMPLDTENHGHGNQTEPMTGCESAGQTGAVVRARRGLQVVLPDAWAKRDQIDSKAIAQQRHVLDSVAAENGRMM